MSDKIAVIISKDRKVLPEHEKRERELLAELEKWPELSVTVVSHLYDLPPDGSVVRLLQSTVGDMVLFSWLYPRAAFWVLNANQVQGRLGPTSSLREVDFGESVGAPSRTAESARTIWCFDLRSHQRVEPYLAEIARIVEPVRAKVSAAIAAKRNGKVHVVEESTRTRWYPVLDFGRCTNCLECLNFCLFGVFGLGAQGEIVIEQADACRPGCPACSRICPAGAIMFPQHDDPAIAGDPAASADGLKLDLSQLFQGMGVRELASAERQRALDEQRRQEAVERQGKSSPGAKESRSADRDNLDRLVDEIDDLDL
jgi:NAD-dependent dihydropyrimidine dehydrogenase PreA subunit